jgi:hypothetical protein
MRRTASVLGLVFAVACGGTGSPSDTAPSPTTEHSASPSGSVAPLVGEWRRVITCQEFVEALQDAGFADVVPQMLAGNGLVPGTPAQLEKKDDICKGAVPREHTHYFTESGTFGSLNHRGKDVGHTTYEIVDDGTFTIGRATFHYEIDGDTITFDVVLEGCGSDCARAVTVALPGKAWERVT